MRTALVRAPGPRLGQGAAARRAPGPVDLARAARQHEAYVAALAEAGLAVHRVEPADECPDAVFVGDTAVVCGGNAVLARLGAPERAAESAGTERALRGLGLRVRALDGCCVMDGGDVLQAGDTLYVGRSCRTDHRALCLLPSLLPARRIVGVKVLGATHLKSAMTALPDGSLIGAPDRLDTSGLPGILVAQEPAGARVLVLGQEHLLLSAAAPRTAGRLRADGWRVTTVDISEFEALDGSVTSLSLLLGDLR